MIYEFQGRKLVFQLSHMRDMMNAKNDNYKLVGHTTHAPIEINEKFTIVKFGTNCDNLPNKQNVFCQY